MPLVGIMQRGFEIVADIDRFIGYRQTLCVTLQEVGPSSAMGPSERWPLVRWQDSNRFRSDERVENVRRSIRSDRLSRNRRQRRRSLARWVCHPAAARPGPSGVDRRNHSRASRRSPRCSPEDHEPGSIAGWARRTPPCSVDTWASHRIAARELQHISGEVLAGA